MNAVQPAVQANPLPNIQPNSAFGMLETVWNAVYEFFAHIAATIYTYVMYAWDTVSELLFPETSVIGQTLAPRPPKPPAPAVPQQAAPLPPVQLAATLAGKLKPYVDCLQARGDRNEFLKLAFLAHRHFLTAVDQRLAAEFQQKTGFATYQDAEAAQVQVPKQMIPNQTEVFWEALETYDAESFTMGTQALVRAYVFSGCQQDLGLFRYGAMRALRNLHQRFQHLPEPERIILLEYDDVTGLQLSQEAIAINRELRAIGSNLMQNNQAYLQAHQAAVALLQPHFPQQPAQQP